MQQYRLSKTLETRQPNHRSIIKCTCTHTQYAYTTRAHMHVYAHSHPHIHTYMHAHATAQHTRTFKNTRTHTGTQTHRHIGRNLKKPGTRFNVDFFKVACSRNLSCSRTNKHGRGCASQVNTYTARQTQTTNTITFLLYVQPSKTVPKLCKKIPRHHFLHLSTKHTRMQMRKQEWFEAARERVVRMPIEPAARATQRWCRLMMWCMRGAFVCVHTQSYCGQ